MQRRIPRSALVVACVAALSAFAAGSAQAAITATTEPATSVTADTAILNGTIASGGTLTLWQFAYSLASNPFQGSETVGGTIPAGTTSTTSVLATASNLIPNTTYTNQLVADNGTFGSTYYLLTPIYGGVITFKTKGPGTASLTSTKLKVKSGRVDIPIKCSNALVCASGVAAITTRHAGKKVSCGSATFTVAAGKKKTVSTGKISAKCKALLVLAPKNTIKAKLVAGFTYQKGISKNVTLKLA